MIKKIKRDGYKIFSSNYWKLVAVCFIVTVVTGGTTISFFRKGFDYVGSNYPIVNNSLSIKSNSEIVDDFMASSDEIKGYMNKYLGKATRGVLATIVNNVNKSDSFLFGVLNAFNQIIFKNRLGSSIVILIGAFISFLYWYLFCNVIKVGKARFFLENRRYRRTRLGRILFCYQDKNYKSVAVTMFKRELYTFLWSLTIIGGIVKHYSYFFVPYILAENPQMKSRDVLRLSAKMVKGYKWKMFLLDLSFIWCYILGFMSLNIFNLLFTNPYREATYAELYMCRRNEYINKKEENYNLLLLEYLNVSVCENEYPNIKKVNKKVKDEKVEYNFWDVILLFFSFSIIGYIWEVLLHLFFDGVFVKRGTLYGPWLTIYGFGGVITFLLFYRYRDNPVKVFFLSMISCGVIEYFTSWYMEALYQARWWDYTGYFLNINGRICLEGLLVFGFGCCISIYFLSPFLIKLFHNIDKKFIKLVTIILLFLFMIDFAFYLIKPNQGNGISSSVSLIIDDFSTYNYNVNV